MDIGLSEKRYYVNIGIEDLRCMKIYKLLWNNRSIENICCFQRVFLRKTNGGMRIYIFDSDLQCNK